MRASERQTADLAPSSGTRILDRRGDIMEAAQGRRRADAAVRPARAKRARANIDRRCLFISRYCHSSKPNASKKRKKLFGLSVVGDSSVE